MDISRVDCAKRLWQMVDTQGGTRHGAGTAIRASAIMSALLRAAKVSDKPPGPAILIECFHAAVTVKIGAFEAAPSDRTATNSHSPPEPRETFGISPGRV